MNKNRLLICIHSLTYYVGIVCICYLIVELIIKITGYCYDIGVILLLFIVAPLGTLHINIHKYYK
jgi:hypothetical protein